MSARTKAKIFSKPFRRAVSNDEPEQRRGDALAAVGGGDIRAHHANVVEGVRVGRERLEILEADNLLIGLPDGHQKHAAHGERLDKAAFVFDRERRVENRIDPLGDNGVENGGDRAGVTGFGGANG
ncbi:MAG: hypothetical protein WD733_02870 [Bryobacterales bacterium]